MATIADLAASLNNFFKDEEPFDNATLSLTTVLPCHLHPQLIHRGLQRLRKRNIGNMQHNPQCAVHQLVANPPLTSLYGSIRRTRCTETPNVRIIEASATNAGDAECMERKKVLLTCASAAIEVHF